MLNKNFEINLEKYNVAVVVLFLFSNCCII